ncbi:hypothetical protein OG394_18220 [Kribbella sp. NBC_01245]|uniref:Calx-beta domain-containing protein n=1 Tax=Kribbella sp. NBC_01245 TaxID=2903578 RepID=UPI002E2A0F82|nr:Calx-beta domain-containing protein [Kribbella sp. NBC_01245]
MKWLRGICALVVATVVVTAGGSGVATAAADEWPKVVVQNTTIDNHGCEEYPTLFTRRVAIQMTPAADQDFKITWMTKAGTAKPEADFIPVTNGLVEVKAGQTVATANVQIRKDMVREQDETFFVVLTSTSDGKLADSVATVTIHDVACNG